MKLENPTRPLWVIFGLSQPTAVTSAFRGNADANDAKADMSAAMSAVEGERYPFSKSGWRKDWARALEAAGIEDFRFHDTRHTAATRTLRASKNLKAVQQMLGHSDITMTARYAHALKDDVLAAMEAAESRNTPERDMAPRNKALKGQNNS